MQLNTLFELLIPALILSLALHEFRRILLNLTTVAIIRVAYKEDFKFYSIPTFTKHLIRPLTVSQSGPQNGFLSVYINFQIHAMFFPTSGFCIIVVGAITVA